MFLVGYPAHACKYSSLFLMLVISKTKFAEIVGVVRLIAFVMCGSVHSFVSGLRLPSHIMLLFLVTDTLVAVNVTVQSSSHNLPIENSECRARRGNMYPLASDLVRPSTFIVHCVLVDSIEPSGRGSLMCRFSLTVFTGTEG